MARRFMSLLVAVAAISAVPALVAVGTAQAEDDGPEPIAAIGHGGFFDRLGNQIIPTPEFVARAQVWYRKHLLRQIPGDAIGRLTGYQSRLSANLELRPQEQLMVAQRSLVWLAESAPSGTVEPAILGKLRALDHLLQLQLPADRSQFLLEIKPFKVNPGLQRLLALSADGMGGPALSGTAAGGADYVKECAAAGVPIPPPIGQFDPAGLTGWKSYGFIPQSSQFIVGSPAELRSYQSDKGMCFALPRYTDGTKTEVQLDGVICLSKTTAAVCIWDNQKNGKSFKFPAGTKVPIGVPDPSINPAMQYQAGGKDIEGGEGGVCTGCHAGENPYIIHPKVDLGGGLLMGKLGLPTFAADRYRPLVAATWPQNASSEPDANVPPPCSDCHTKDDGGGRFPDFSTNLADYCGILNQAILRTMPPNRPGGMKDDPAVKALLAKCLSSSPPTK